MSHDVVEDPWQARLDRMRRLLPLPLLVAATVVTLAVPSSSPHSWARFEIGVPLASAAAVLWLIVSTCLRGNPSTRWRLTVFAVHTVLAAVLVWVNLVYGVFAYIGFLFAYGLGPRWRAIGFAVTALVVAASLAGGYPSSNATRSLTYLLIAVVLVGLVLNSASITNRAVAQNRERGQMIDALADANRRLEASMAENVELHTKLLAQARQAGVLEERRRLAGEIHDTLAQGLAGIIAQLQAAEQTSHRRAEWSRHLTLAASLARDSLTEARRSVRALRPEQLEDASLGEALSTLARTWSEQSGVPAELHTIGCAAPADPQIEAALFRVAQEALSNVAKHARATKVRITLTYIDDALLLDVVDDGIGFDISAGTHGYGLLGMRQRLERVGGTLTAEAGSGTTLNAAVPLPGSDGPRR